MPKSYSFTSAAAPQAAIDSSSRMKPRTIARRPETSITASKARSSIVIGIGWSGPHQKFETANRRVGAGLGVGGKVYPARPEIKAGNRVTPGCAGCIAARADKVTQL